MRFTIRPARILDFDCETRPLTYIGHDFTTAEITAIACSFGLEDDMHCWILGNHDGRYMLREFLRMYNLADMVTGHYIRKFDLPLINGAMLEYGMHTLPPKLVCDTKEDLRPIQNISLSQESLGEMLTGIRKVHMTQADWRSANRLVNFEATENRVTGDVRQHQALRLKLVQLNMLEPPSIWNGK